MRYNRQALFKVYIKDGKVFADEYEATGYNFDDESFDYPNTPPIHVGKELVPDKIGYEIEIIPVLDERGIEEIKENGGACWYGLSKVCKFVGKVELLEHRGHKLYGVTRRDIRIIPAILMTVLFVHFIMFIGKFIIDLFI